MRSSCTGDKLKRYTAEKMCDRRNVNPMAEVLTLEEMKLRYDGEWILVACTEMDAQLNPIRGEVVAHSVDRDTIYDEIAAHRHAQTGTLAIEYMGDIPEDWAAIL
jgi:hypothetical protein